MRWTRKKDGERWDLYVLFGVVLGWLLLAAPLCMASQIGMSLQLEMCDTDRPDEVTGNCTRLIRGKVELDSQNTESVLLAKKAPINTADGSGVDVNLTDPSATGYYLRFVKEPVIFHNTLHKQPATMWWSYVEPQIGYGESEQICPRGVIVHSHNWAENWAGGGNYVGGSGPVYNEYTFQDYEECVKSHWCHGHWTQRGKTDVLGGRPPAFATARAVAY
eukprot:GHVU01148226.1.p1 GENE.GHVU01148226.1~~GHVU01148226.1.p1  ORF type:complete len:219 (-),score=12.98 GHVU01148226.1:4171-4827(-)